MATLYREVIRAITESLRKRFPITDLRFINSDIEDIIYKSYVRWEENGGVELQLPSFKLTNRQMLWLCLVHMSSYKSHTKKINSIFNHNFLERPAFREAFQCIDPKEIGKLELEE